jgi:ferredoxin
MPTIIVNQDLCNKCNTCAIVCVSQIIEKANVSNFPEVLEANERNCIKCGHCESFCTHQALTLNYNIDQKVEIAPLDGQIEEQELALYLKKRRSIRYFLPKPVDKKIIEEIIDVARYAASGGNSQPVKWLVIYDSAEVKHIASLTIDWMRTIVDTKHPYVAYVFGLITAWDNGLELICRNVFHFVIVHLPNIVFDIIDAIIAFTHFDIAAPAFGIGAIWVGFVKMAMVNYKFL